MADGQDDIIDDSAAVTWTTQAADAIPELYKYTPPPVTEQELIKAERYASCLRPLRPLVGAVAFNIAKMTIICEHMDS